MGAIDRIDRANRELFCEVARRTAGARIVERNGLLLIAGAHSSPVIVNTAYRLRPELSRQDALDQMREFYDDLGHGFGLMVSERRDADLEQVALRGGWMPVIELPAMVLDKPPHPVVLGAGATLRVADSLEDLIAFRGVLQAGFAEDADEVEMIASAFAQPASIAGDNVRVAIVSVDGAAVAAGLVMVLDATAVIAWVATVPSHRRRGLGVAVTAFLAAAGFELGASQSTLLASPMGVPVYQRLGYRTVARYRVLFPPDQVSR